MDERLEQVWARWCARRVLHLWDAPEVVRRWLDEGDERLHYLAEVAAKVPAPSPTAQAQRARMAIAGSLWATDSEEARWVSRWAVQAVSTGAVAESHAQDNVRDLLAILPELLRTHGLAARLLDDAREDPWLTREVVRALGLSDLAVWVDWCAQMTGETP